MTVYDTDPPAVVLAAGLISPNESDANGEPANVVDGLFAIARAIDRLTAAIRSDSQQPRRLCDVSCAENCTKCLSAAVQEIWP